MGLALAIGKFDALHRGHFALIQSAARLGEPCLLSFSGMAEVLGWEKRLPLLAESLRQDTLASWSQQIGKTIQEIAIPFAEVRQLNPQDFIVYLQEHHAFSAIVTGDNFRFAYKREGDVNSLQQLSAIYHFALDTVTAVEHGRKIISSSRVRQAVQDGDMFLLNKLLNRPFALCGVVIAGEQRGRQLGFPTANIADIEQCIPAVGVYAAKIILDGQPYAAAINIGHLPTVSAGRSLSVEAHIINWSGDCYGQKLTVHFIQRLRDEQRFENLDALKQQIAADVAACKKIVQCT